MDPPGVMGDLRETLSGRDFEPGLLNALRPRRWPSCGESGRVLAQAVSLSSSIRAAICSAWRLLPAVASAEVPSGRRTSMVKTGA